MMKCLRVRIGVTELKPESMKVKDWSVIDGDEGLDVGILLMMPPSGALGGLSELGEAEELMFAAPIV